MRTFSVNFMVRPSKVNKQGVATVVEMATS